MKSLLLSVTLFTTFLAVAQPNTSNKQNSITTNMQHKAVVYQVFTRLFGNTNTTNKPWGTIEENGVGERLLGDLRVNSIEIDGADNKWFGTDSGGVLYTNPSGQRTLANFSRQNSPLPSNRILKIRVDDSSGKVFFATDKGMVSFLGTSTKPSDNLANVFVYPNPVRPNYSGTIKIAGLTDKANIKITDIEGNLVHETTSSGGTIEWDGSAFGSHKVASGVYMIFVSSQDGLDTTVKKVMIIR